MWKAVADGSMPKFWPPRANRFWSLTLGPFRQYALRSYLRVAELEDEGWDSVAHRLAPHDSILIAPNHSHDTDPVVLMEVAKRHRQQFYFMAAWQLFRHHGGLDGFIMQRMGAFSVDREGCDRRAVKQAVKLLTSGGRLVIFPEGDVYHLNERLTPLLEGVAFIGLTAQRQLEHENNGARVWSFRRDPLPISGKDRRPARIDSVYSGKAVSGKSGGWCDSAPENHFSR
jgi:hypothetical protein